MHIYQKAFNEAVEIWRSGNPDGESKELEVASRDLNCKLNGNEQFRRVIYPGKSDSEWPESERLPAFGIRASERHCAVTADVPIGTIVVDYDRSVYRGKRGQCKVSFGLFTRQGLVELKHKTLRSRPAYLVEIDIGLTIEVARREDRS